MSEADKEDLQRRFNDQAMRVVEEAALMFRMLKRSAKAMSELEIDHGRYCRGLKDGVFTCTCGLFELADARDELCAWLKGIGVEV